MCGSIAAKSRVHVAIAIDSIGYEDFYSLLHYCLGINYDICLINQHKKLDAQRQYKYNYEQRQEVRRRRAILISQRIHKMVHRVLKDKKAGKQYKSRINVEQKKENDIERKPKKGKNNKEDNDNNDDSKKKGKAKNKTKKCKSCGLEGYVRITHRSCLKNKRNAVLMNGKLWLFLLWFFRCVTHFLCLTG